MSRLPPYAILLGAAGLVPFAVLGFGAVLPAYGGRCVVLLIAYGAVILSFLGGVHQGFAMLAPAPLPDAVKPPGEAQRAERRRLLGASLVALIAWIALALSTLMAPVAGLAVLLAAFIALPVIEQRAVAYGWMPKPYMRLRWVLTVLVCAILATVLVLRLFGATSS